jgi:dienelactone hydrolase
MTLFTRLVAAIIIVHAFAGALNAEENATRLLAPGVLPHDARLGRPKDLNGYFPFVPPSSRQQWEARRAELRQQILVATGLWPLPDKTPLQPVIHGRIDRDDYTIEKVFFASYPGHYVSGNLYRPKGKPGKRAAILSPHGHWRDGRFYEAKETEAQSLQQQGAEKTLTGARYPLQARCAQLARMGCVVFHYDMVGYADSRQIHHATGFSDAEAELRLQSFMGLQTYNSIRALDFLASLPDVDPTRIGVTGASGGGTQSFILCAIDDRPAAAFPAVMVSTAMQGGCVCENCSYLRQGTGNVELAALFAPKPLGMTGANDWTREIETKGLPELKALYRLYGAQERVMARCFPQFGHNYNQVSRELMYNWFNVHLRLGQALPVVEQPFVPVPPRELSVFDETHPRPKDAADVSALRQYLTNQAQEQLRRLEPTSVIRLQNFRAVLGAAFNVMIHDQLPASELVETNGAGSAEQDGALLQSVFLGRRGEHEQIPALVVAPAKPNGSVVVWIHPRGKSSLLRDGKLDTFARAVLQKGTTILAPDVFGTGEFGSKRLTINSKYAGFTFGYNRPLLANRVHDILTAVAIAKGELQARAIDLVGFDKAGPWVLIARALCGSAVRRTVANVDEFDFNKVTSIHHEMMLPGALKYGGLATAAALCAPAQLYVHNTGQQGLGNTAREAYRAAGTMDCLTQSPIEDNSEKILGWLLR